MLHRLVFNAARAMRVVVQETARSAGKATGATSVVLATALPFALASAQIVGAPGGPSNLRPVVLQAPNGVPLVNIQTPSAAGVSRNLYHQFDVQSRGVILNNSRTDVQTQLGGRVQANPFLANGPARIILNEVVSGHPTQLRGAIEVAGQRAEVIVANPAGIAVDGGTFINASRATLTTGTPQFDAAGGLEGYVVRDGTVALDGAGLDARSTDYAAILARAVKVNAGLWANELKVLTGANQVSADHARATPTTGTGALPVFALDVAHLGGMYAGKIRLIGNEHGVGARNAGTIMAADGSGPLGDVGELVVTAAGRLEHIGTMQAGARADIAAGSLVNGGRIVSGGDLKIATQGALGNAPLLAMLPLVVMLRSRAAVVWLPAWTTTSWLSPRRMSPLESSLPSKPSEAASTTRALAAMTVPPVLVTLRVLALVFARGSPMVNVSPAEMRPAVLSMRPVPMRVVFVSARMAPDALLSVVAVTATFPPSMPWFVPSVFALVIVPAFRVVAPDERISARVLSMTPASMRRSPSAAMRPASFPSLPAAIAARPWLTMAPVRLISSPLLAICRLPPCTAPPVLSKRSTLALKPCLASTVPPTLVKLGPSTASFAMESDPPALSSCRVASVMGPRASMRPPSLRRAPAAVMWPGPGTSPGDVVAPVLPAPAAGTGLFPITPPPVLLTLFAVIVSPTPLAWRIVPPRLSMSPALASCRLCASSVPALAAGNALTLSARSIDNTATGDIQGKTTRLAASEAITNRGVIDGVVTRIDAGTLNNLGTGRIYGDAISLGADTLNNLAETVDGVTSAATIAARHRMDIGARAIENRDGSLIYSDGDMAIGGHLDAAGQATGAAASLTNHAATIEAARSASIRTAVLSNTNGGVTWTLVPGASEHVIEYAIPGSATRHRASEVLFATGGYLLTNNTGWNNWVATDASNPLLPGANANARLLLPSPDYPLERFRPYYLRSPAHSADRSYESCNVDACETTAMPGAWYSRSDPIWATFGVAPPAADLPESHPGRIDPGITVGQAGLSATVDGPSGPVTVVLQRFDHPVTQAEVDQWQAYRAAHQALDVATLAFIHTITGVVRGPDGDKAPRLHSIYDAFDYSVTPSTPVLQSSAPARLLAGGAMDIQVGAGTNDMSQILAGGTLSITGGTNPGRGVASSY